MPRLSLLLTLTIALAATGCGTAPSTTTTTSAGPGPTPTAPEVIDPQTQARQALRQSPGLEGCRAAIQSANALRASTPAERTALSPTDTANLKSRWGLSDAELAEVTASDFTKLDTYHLEESLLFRDAARTLGVDGRPVEERAKAAMTWVNRQVALSAPAGQHTPPAFAARRGWGTPLERAGVALALARQLGLDAVLVGLAADSPWAVGFRESGRIYLFSIATGQPLTLPDGKPIPFADLQAKPEEHLPRLEAAGVKGLTAGELRLSSLWLAPSLSTLAGRMPALERLVEPTGAVRLGFAEGSDAKPAVQSRVVRGLTRFLLPAEGGIDSAPVRPGMRPPQIQFNFELVPWRGFPPTLAPDGPLAGPFVDRARALIMGRFAGVLTSPNQPRELILRGRFTEAEKLLIDQRDELRQVYRRIEAELPGIAEGNRLAELERRANGWLERLQKAIEAKAEAETRLAELQAEPDAKLVGLQIERNIADLLTAELTWQLALCKHEQAVRLETQAGTEARRPEAWRAAATWWTSWLRQYEPDIASDDPKRKEVGTGRLVSVSRYEQAKRLVDEARR